MYVVLWICHVPWGNKQFDLIWNGHSTMSEPECDGRNIFSITPDIVIYFNKQKCSHLASEQPLSFRITSCNLTIHISHICDKISATPVRIIYIVTFCAIALNIHIVRYRYKHLYKDRDRQKNRERGRVWECVIRVRVITGFRKFSPMSPWSHRRYVPLSKVNGINMGPTWVLSDPKGSHVGLINSLRPSDAYMRH